MKLPSLATTLLVNVICSAAVGAVLVVAPTTMAGVIGEVPAWLCQLVGAGLLLFAAWVYWISRRLPDARTGVTWVFALDMVWVVGVPVVMVVFASYLTLWGHSLLGGSALLVAGFAWLEWYWVRRISDTSRQHADAV
ncbi:MAG: hypothetical protein CMQ34_04595 [Gammaproteobacteria bacterium]|nr:hypothetical protein [Gammaproteobacteria bacterium]|tara:strand:- start:1840 stop:2250 length:411 start_codon:yes stop_codon:yes gene_type:complete